MSAPHRSAARRAAAGVLLTAGILSSLAGCGWRGLNSMQLPGTAGGGPGAYTIQAQLPDVSNLEPNSRVQVGDVTVGNVTKIERQGWHALLTIALDGDVELPANATATIGQTSLLGSLHIELAPPTDVPPAGKLTDGALIPMSSGSSHPTTEQTLGAIALLLNGSGVGQVQDISEALSTALTGRADELRSLIQQIDVFVGSLNEQTGDIIAATDSLNNLVGQIAAAKPVVDNALDTVPDALGVISDERQKLVDALDQFAKFSALVADSTIKTKDNVVRELQDLGPVMESLADAGPALTHALSLLATYPFPKETIGKWARGDYANLTAIIDLTLSRLDASFFTGTRWEGDLTELEIQWGRTIGQLPSPYTVGNPLVAPYHWEQGP